MHRDELGSSVIVQQKLNNVNSDVLQLFASFKKIYGKNLARPTESNIHVANGQ